MIATPPRSAVDDKVRDYDIPLIKPLKNCPRQQTSDLVHTELSKYFTNLFPGIIIDREEIHYQLELADFHSDPIDPPVSLRNFHEIPEDEVYHLLQGWIRLQQALASEEIHPDAKEALENFRVPDPRKGIECYRVYEDEGREKMFIEWGLEKEECPAVKLDQALAVILGIPVSKLQSILFTFMITVLPNETIHHSLLQAEQESEDFDETAYSNPQGIFADPILRYTSIAAGVILSVATLMTFQWSRSQPHPRHSPVYSLQELSPTTAHTPETNQHISKQSPEEFTSLPIY